MEEQGQLIEPYELMMLENHRIPGLLPMQSVVADGRRRYLYEISGKQQIEEIGRESCRERVLSHV